MKKVRVSAKERTTMSTTADDHNESEDAFFSNLKTLRTEYSRILAENGRLKAQLHDVQCDNLYLKLESMETRAPLGEAAVIICASKQVCCVVLL